MTADNPVVNVCITGRTRYVWALVISLFQSFSKRDGFKHRMNIHSFVGISRLAWPCMETICCLVPNQPNHQMKILVCKIVVRGMAMLSACGKIGGCGGLIICFSWSLW